MTPKSSKRIICPCLRVTETEVRESVRAHQLQTLGDITRFTEAGDGCTACHGDLERIIREETTSPSPTARKGSSRSRFPR